MKKFLSLICVMLLLASCASKPQEEVKPEETTPEEEPVVETVSLVETTVPSTTRDAAIPPKKKCRLPLRKNITMLLLDLNLIKANLHA